MFASVALAGRIEGAEARLSRAVGEAVRDAGSPDVLVVPVGGGVVVYAGEGSPVNKMICVGFGAPIEDGALQEAERWFAERHAPLQAEVSILADPAAWRTLVDRGYRLEGFENVLGLDLSSRRDGARTRSPAGLAISPVADAAGSEWLDAMIDGFSHPDARDETGHAGGGREQGAAADDAAPAVPSRELFERFYGTPGFRRYVARWNGVLAGGGSLRIDAGVAQLCGAATLPAFRRRGIQSALLAARLDDAREHGCDLATVTTQPGSKSQQNAQRQGFALLYTRALQVKGC